MINSKKLNLILVSMSFIILMVNIEYTGIAILIPPITKTLHFSISQTQWIASIYLLTFSALIIIAGRIGDIYNSRYVVSVGLVIFSLGSLLGGLAQVPWEMLTARALQGIGAALMWPNVTAIAFNSAPAEKKAFAISIVTSVIGFSMAIGPFLAGYFAQVLSWRWFFLLNVPLGIAILIHLLFFIPKEQQPRQPHTLDILGLIVLILFLVSLIIGIDSIKDIVANKVLICSLFIFAVILLSALIYIENRAQEPLLSLYLFKNHHFLIGCLTRSLTNFSFYIFIFITGLYLHLALGFLSLSSGIIFLPMTLIIGTFSLLSGKIIAKKKK